MNLKEVEKALWDAARNEKLFRDFPLVRILYLSVENPLDTEVSGAALTRLNLHGHSQTATALRAYLDAARKPEDGPQA